MVYYNFSHNYQYKIQHSSLALTALELSISINSNQDLLDPGVLFNLRELPIFFNEIDF